MMGILRPRSTKQIKGRRRDEERKNCPSLALRRRFWSLSLHQDKTKGRRGRGGRGRERHSEKRIQTRGSTTGNSKPSSSYWFLSRPDVHVEYVVLFNVNQTKHRLLQMWLSPFLVYSSAFIPLWTLSSLARLLTSLV